MKRPAASILLAAVLLSVVEVGLSVASVPTAPDLPPAALDEWPLRSLAPAVDAFRSGDLATAHRLLAAAGDDDPQRRLLLGLYAASSGDLELAATLLPRAGDRSGLLEDWRLHALAEVQLAREDLAGAAAASQRLLSAHVDSPLYDEAYRRHLEVLRRQGDWLGALRGIDAARQLELHDALAPRLDTLQWEIAEERGLIDLQRETARHLLVHHPLIAARLEAVELLRQPDGEIDWAGAFDAEELVERARRLLAGDLATAALTALEAVPPSARELDWTLLEAAALTQARRGTEALEVLAARASTPHERLTELWRARAEAALDAATVRRGRRNADSAEREEWRQSAWRDLWQIVLRGREDAHVAALVKLYRLADVEANFDIAVDILERLRAADSDDITGYRDLWKLGWRSFERDDAPVAIGIWRRLQDLYPEVSTARQALYWSAVAHGRLGDADRSRRLLLEVVAADTLDFYSLHAARRLGIDPARGPALAVTEGWPSSPLLARTALLTELGLDDSAKHELELLRNTVEPRAVEALDALILARQGDRRESIQAAWRAFRRLGKPGQTAIPRNVRELYYPLEFADPIDRWAERRGIDRELVFAIIRQESAFDAGAVSRAGARGLMQLMPATGRELAGKLGLPYSRSRLNQPEYSVQLGTRYFAQVLDMFGGDVELALAGYNGGPYRIRRWWREAGPNRSVDRFVEGLSLTETTSYVKRIVTLRDAYELMYGAG